MKPARFSALTAIAAMSLSLSLSMTACVEDVGEIDRTQANALVKKDFRGVWYKLAAVTDMPASSGYNFVGYSSYEGKFLFDVTESHLIVYPYSEKVKDGDAKWHKRSLRKYWDEGHEDEFVEVITGNPVAMYPITSHFDIQRQYSTSTGAQSNVLEENTSDRPWYKRKYFRVNWMGNTYADEFRFKDGEISVSSADFYVQDQDKTDPNKFHMEDGYFHYTRRLHGQPQSTGWCSTYSLAPGDCSGSVFDVRVSYKRADPRAINDFEIRDYHDTPHGDRFGYFLSARHTYDEDFGLTYAGHDYKAQIWNLWRQSKTFKPIEDDKGNKTSCLTNYDCAKPAVCDQAKWFEPGYCALSTRIEYTQRGIRPIVYHLSEGHPVTHLPASYKVADNWSDVFKDTVSWLFFWEAKWAEDGVKGFEQGQSNFGQRYCQSDADCANHKGVLGHISVKDNDDANSLFVATGVKDKGVYVKDVLGNRKSSAAVTAAGGELAGNAFVIFVNASPDSAPATLKVGSVSIPNVAFKAGVINGHDTAALLPDSEAGKLTLEVTAGSAKASLPNALIQANRINFVVFFGGDQLAVVRNSFSLKGVRIFHGAKTGVIKPLSAEVSDGPKAEAGVNGVRGQGYIEYGQASDYLYFTGSTVSATLVKRGSRGDVSCADVQGVGQCIGWGQHLTAEDRAERLKIKASLPDVFVQCTNVYSGDNCGDSKGKASAMNDCRYWAKDKDGKEYNPCKLFVPSYDKPKVLGDIRYNYNYWVTNPHASSPLGYGPSGADPDTGQLVWGVAHIYGASLTTYGQYGKDLVDLLNGDLSTEDLTMGKHIQAYLQKKTKTAYDKSLPGAAHEHEPAAGQDFGPGSQMPTSMKEAASRATADISSWGVAKPSDLDKLRKLEPELAKMQDTKELSKYLLKEFPTFDMEVVAERMKKIKGTGLESAMINDEMALVLSGGQVQPGDAIPPEMIDKISPAGWAIPTRSTSDRVRMRKLASENIYDASFMDTSLVAMAKRLKCQEGQKPTDKLPGGPDSVAENLCYKGDALRLALQLAIFRGVLEHELGHTFGLRHNFSASADALNYFDPYYTIREKEPVYCRSFSTPFGVITANDMCEDILGEECVSLACSADKDCPTGYACGQDDKGKAVCVDSKQNTLGTCHGDTETKITCKADAECGTGGKCNAGLCFEMVSCAGDDDCTDGEVCSGGFCAHAVTAKARMTQKYDVTKGELLKYMPRPAPTAKEIELKRMENQYSSIMDYGQKINADFLGLGKYDYAAIRYGYGRLADIFADTSYMRHQVDKVVKNTASTPESASWRMGTSSWEFAGSFRHPFEYLNNWMPPEYLVQRDAVPAFFPDLEEEIAGKYGRNDHDRTMFQVPYKYCSDEYRGGSMACYYFDTGAHLQEIVYHANEQLQEYYIFDAFKRERMWYGTGGNPLAYMNRVMDRYMTPIGAAARYYALYNNIYRVYSFFTFVDQHPMYLKALRESSESSFRILSGILTSPAPGAYTLDKARNEYVNTSFEMGTNGAGKLNIPLGQGKLPWTTFSTKKGYYYADHPAWIGAYWEKIAAIMTMTNSSASFLTDFVGEQLPIFRGTAIGFNTIYPKELSTVLGGLAAGAVEEVGAVVDDTDPTKAPVVVPRDPFAPANKSLPRVAPSIMNLSLRLFSAWQAIANLPAGFDPSFTDSMAVWLKGSGLSYTFGCKDGGNNGGKCESLIEHVEFEDPFGKKTYVAPKVNYNKDYFSPTYSMLTRLNAMKKKWALAQGADKAELAARMKEELEVVDYFRQLYKVYGSIGL